MNRCQERDQHLSNLTLTILSDSTVTTLTLPSLFVCFFVCLFVCCCCFVFFCQRRGGGVGWRAQSAWTTAAHRQGRQGRSIHSPSHHIISHHITSYHTLSSHHIHHTKHVSYQYFKEVHPSINTSIHHIHLPPPLNARQGGRGNEHFKTHPPLSMYPLPLPPLTLPPTMHRGVVATSTSKHIA